MASRWTAGGGALAAIAAAGLALWSCADPTTTGVPTRDASAGWRRAAARTVSVQDTPPPAGVHVEVPPPPLSEGIFPCSDCHAEPDLPPNRTRRILVDAHDDIVLRHDEEQRWCLDCHDAVNRDRLHLASGDLVTFAESYRVCGQCHGEKYRDWRAGVHGRRTGEWNGRKEYQLCVHCHDPHAPRFKSMAPKPAPLPPSHAGVAR